MKTQGCVWAFDLGKGSIGEAVRNGNEFLHKASLLIPADFADTKPAAARRRMWRTRIAHHERERWLEQVWAAAGLPVLYGRNRDQKTGERKKPGEPANYRLEREFAPHEFRTDADGKRVRVKYPNDKASDGAPAAAKEDFETCYTSCLLRIKLLRGDTDLKDWQIFKALRSAIQKRGFGSVPWGGKEARRAGFKSEKEMQEAEDKKLAQADPDYQRPIKAWKDFKARIQNLKLEFVEAVQPSDEEKCKRRLGPHYYFVPPSLYDACEMGLCDLAKDLNLRPRSTFAARSTRKIRFDREDVESEIILLANHAAEQFSQLKNCFQKIKQEGWRVTDKVSGQSPKADVKYRDGQRVRQLSVLADSLGEFLCFGPGGEPYAASNPTIVKELEIRVLEHPDLERRTDKKPRLRQGTDLDWLGATGQKIPRFDNRILEDCTLIPRFHVCRASPRRKWMKATKQLGRLERDSLLHCIVVFLMKLVNMRVDDPKQRRQRGLSASELRKILAATLHAAKKVNLNEAGWERKVGERFKLTQPRWSDWCEEFGVRPVTQAREKGSSEQDEDDETPDETESVKTKESGEAVKSPNTQGRSRFSKPALKIVKDLVLSGKPPTKFFDALVSPDSRLAAKLRMSVFPNGPDAPDGPQHRKLQETGLTHSDLEFIKQMWKPKSPDEPFEVCRLFLPNQRLEQLARNIGTTQRSLSELRREMRERDHCTFEQHANCAVCQSERAIRKLIGSQNDPIVRHRLEVFWQRLQALEQMTDRAGLPIGEPSRIVLELVRDDLEQSWLGKKSKEAIQDFQEERRKAREEARKMLAQANIAAKDRNITMYQLWKAQGGVCLYGKEVFEKDGSSKARCVYLETGLPLTKLDTYRIDHIFPQARGGPDAFANLILTTNETNERKGDRSPYEWFQQDRPDEWEHFKTRVFGRAKALGYKKVQMLISADHSKLIQKYTALAETAWISKLAQMIIRLHFGWPLDHQPGTERIVTVSGGLTGRVRRKYFLNSLTGASQNQSLPDDTEERELFEVNAEVDRADKDRSDCRHHALDAMVLTYLGHWVSNTEKEDFFRFDEIGDNPCFPPSVLREVGRLKGKIEKLKAEFAHWEKSSAPESRAKRESIQTELTQTWHELHRLKQGRNWYAVRGFFKRQLDGATDGAVLVQHLHSPKARLEGWYYRRAFALVEDENGVDANDGKLQWKVDGRKWPLRDIAYVENDSAEVACDAARVFDFPMLRRRVQAIAPHAAKTPAYDAKLLRAWLSERIKRWQEEKAPAHTDEQHWDALCEHSDLPWLAKPKRGGEPPREIRLYKLEEKRTTRRTATHRQLCDIAFKKGVFKDFRPEELAEKIPSLVLRPSRQKKEKKSRTTVTRNPAASIGLQPDTELQARLRSPGMQAAFSEFFTSHPHYTTQDKAGKQAKKDWEKHWEAFMEQHGLSLSKTVYVKTGEADPSKPAFEKCSLENFVMHVHPARFNVRDGLKNVDSICDPWIRLQVRVFLRAASTVERRVGQQLWLDFCAVFSQTKKKQWLAFRQANPNANASDWLEFYKQAKERAGSTITHVQRIIGHDPRVYPDLSDDKTGIHVTQDGNRGFYAYAVREGEAESYKIQAVRTFENPRQIRQRLERKSGVRLLDEKMWKVKMSLKLSTAVKQGDQELRPGVYILETIQNEESAHLCQPDGVKTKKPIGVKRLLEAVFGTLNRKGEA